MFCSIQIGVPLSVEAANADGMCASRQAHMPSARRRHGGGGGIAAAAANVKSFFSGSL
jgi:hypothetical protein